MNLILEKTIHLVSSEDVDEISCKIIEIIQSIQTVSQSDKVKMQDSNFFNLLSCIFKLSNQSIKLSDIASKIEYVKDYRIQSKRLRGEYHNIIPMQQLEALENLEIYIDAITQLTASQFMILSAIVYKSDAIEYLKIFYTGLSYIQQVVEKHLYYLPDKIKKSIIHLAQDILNNYQYLIATTGNGSISIEKANLFKNINNTVKAIIYDINNPVEKAPKKFKNLDELWDYWDEIYEEEEMEETAETLIKALNETRERQGRPKLFEKLSF